MHEMDFLQQVYTSAETGRDGLKRLIEQTDAHDLRVELAEQYAGYQEIMNEIRGRFAKRGQSLKEATKAEMAMGDILQKIKVVPADEGAAMVAKEALKLTEKSHKLLPKVSRGTPQTEQTELFERLARQQMDNAQIIKTYC